MSFRTVFLTVTMFFAVAAVAYLNDIGYEIFREHSTAYTAVVLTCIFFIGFLVDRSDKRKQQRQDRQP